MKLRNSEDGLDLAEYPDIDDFLWFEKRCCISKFRFCSSNRLGARIVIFESTWSHNAE